MPQAVHVDEQIAHFRKDVLPRLVERYRPTRVLLFGSRARGEAREWSDLDVLIVSAAFAGVSWQDRIRQVTQECDVRLDVEPLCYTPEEFEGKVRELGIVRVAATEGVDLLGGPPLRVAEPRRAGPGDVRGWVEQAQRDLENARRVIGVGAFEVAAFLAQQAVEKRLKAAWILVKQEVPPHTHSISNMGDGLGVPAALRPALVDLDRDYVAARYPDAPTGVPYRVYDGPMAERKVAAAEALFEWIKRLTGEAGQ